MMYMTHVGHQIGAQSVLVKRKDKIPKKIGECADKVVSINGLFLDFICPVTLKTVLSKQSRKGIKVLRRNKWKIVVYKK